MEKKALREIFNISEMNSIAKKIFQTKKKGLYGDDATYEDIEIQKDGVTYKISAEHVTVAEIMKYSKSGCRTCGGLGRKIVNILKTRIPDPDNYVIFSETPIDTMPPEEKKIWIEKQKQNPFWRILLPCECALKKIGKTEDIFSNPLGNITMRLDYEILDDDQGN